MTTLSDDERAELRALNVEAMDLLRQAQACDTELAALRDVPGKDQVRAALIGRRNALHRQRFTVKQRAKDIGRRVHEQQRAEAVGFMGGASATALLREAAQRTGMLEKLYVDLCRGADGAYGEAFDWQRPLAKARKVLGQLPDWQESVPPGDGAATTEGERR